MCFLNQFNAQSFEEFWLTFQKKMVSKTAILPHISFPYTYSCNYLSDGQVSREEFLEHGIEIFINGNAFISNCFSEINYPSIEDISIQILEDGYINEYLKTQFLEQYGNLNDIYYLSEIGNENDAIGYKAYFKRIEENFYFIGFEGQEQGD